MLCGWKRVVAGVAVIAILAGTGVYLIATKHPAEGGGALGLIGTVVLWLIRPKPAALPAGNGKG